jgi:hypothetical protein
MSGRKRLNDFYRLFSILLFYVTSSSVEFNIFLRLPEKPAENGENKDQLAVSGVNGLAQLLNFMSELY